MNKERREQISYIRNLLKDISKYLEMVDHQALQKVIDEECDSRSNIPENLDFYDTAQVSDCAIENLEEAQNILHEITTTIDDIDELLEKAST
mgnify:CR=1 FL=1